MNRDSSHVLALFEDAFVWTNKQEMKENGKAFQCLLLSFFFEENKSSAAKWKSKIKSTSAVNCFESGIHEVSLKETFLNAGKDGLFWTDEK